MSISSPVFGFLPFLASRLLSLKAPKPSMETRLPAETSYRNHIVGWKMHRQQEGNVDASFDEWHIYFFSNSPL
jgi:hypothetical protein